MKTILSKKNITS